MSNKKEIISKPTTLTPVETLQKSIASFNEPLSNYLSDIGLPTENILQTIPERENVLNSLKSIVELLPIDEKGKAFYLSKFAITVAVGLFDGALNYLWDETIKCIRKMINNFDLFYFFFVATSVSSRYKNFKSEEDLELINDHDLLEICRRIGLINEINFKRLEYVNYLRNHASAAHPNDNEISGFELVANLENCIKYAILAKPDHSSIQIKRLLSNIRNISIPGNDIPVIGREIELLTQERLDDLLFTFFGMYCDDKRTTIIEQNIESLAVFVFSNSSIDKKLEIGSKYGFYRKQGEVLRKERVYKFLEIVDGLSFRDEDSLAAELIDKLQELKSVHYEWNNFYNEYSHAKSIIDSIPATGIIPVAAKKDFVKVISICYIGNGLGYREGVCESALPFYEKSISLFSDDEIIFFLKMFSDTEFYSNLQMTMTSTRARKLANILKEKTKNPLVIEILDVIIKHPPKHLSDLYKVSDFKDKLNRLLKNK